MEMVSRAGRRFGATQLGKIFDVTGQRERAVNEYRQALQTNDNTQGALEESRRYMQKPFEREKGKLTRRGSAPSPYDRATINALRFEIRIPSCAARCSGARRLR